MSSLRRRVIAGLGVAALVTGLPATATADVVVAVTFPRVEMRVDPVATTTDHRVSFGFFRDSRVGMRIRQLGFGDPTIRSTTNAICDTNFFANDVVCHDGSGIAGPIAITMGGGDDTVSALAWDQSTPLLAEACFPVPHPATPTSVTLGFGNDVLRTVTSFLCASGLSYDPLESGHPDEINPRYTSVDGGPGNDNLQGGLFADVIAGGPDQDTIHGGEGKDSVSGGTGDDALFGDAGDDTISGGTGANGLHGGGGDDTLFPDAAGTDVVDGGDGRDRVLYGGTVGAVRVTIGDNSDQDGLVGFDHDVVLSTTEDVTTGDGPDSVVGSGESNDLVTTGGADAITAGAGTDTVEAGGGADTIDIRDGELDPRVDCGPGTDAVTVDLKDQPSRLSIVRRTAFIDCEAVSAFATDDGPPGHAAGRTLRVAGERASVAVACPARARVACRGTLSLRAGATLRGATLGAARYRIAVGTTADVTVDLTTAGRRVAGMRHITARTVENGTSAKGPRSAVVVLRPTT